MPLSYMFHTLWQWMADKGITLLIIIVIGLIIPRIGRYAIHVINTRIEDSNEEQEGKSRLALTGVVVYLIQLVAYFLLFVYFLNTLGFSLAGAAIPATVASAAIGLGAQNIIADFLAGFFILTEKQFGIGDWVRFEGNGIEVEGTVTKITMRATRIRTLAQETVIIPNSTSKVCVNSSNYWSRAVVTMPIPLLGSHSPEEAVHRAESAARRTLQRPEIVNEITSDLDVQPSVNITPPTTVGVPWTVDVRFLVQVRAGNQYWIERAMRTDIIKEFWDEYGSAPTMTGEVRQTLKPVDSSRLSDTEAQTEIVSHAEKSEATADQHPTGQLHDVSIIHRDRVAAEQEARMEQGSGPITEALNSPKKADLPTDETAEFKKAEAPADDSKTSRDTTSSAGSEISKDTASDQDRSGMRFRIRRILSVGGRARPSTSVLIGALLILLFLRASVIQTGEGWDGGDGWLAPSHPTPVEQTEEESDSSTSGNNSTDNQQGTNSHQEEGTGQHGNNPDGSSQYGTQNNQNGTNELNYHNDQGTGTTDNSGTDSDSSGNSGTSGDTDNAGNSGASGISGNSDAHGNSGTPGASGNSGTTG